MERNKVVAWSVAALIVSLSGIYATTHITPVRAAAAAQASSDPVIYLNQGWSKADRDTYYWIPQGTVMMSYDIYQNLELAGAGCAVDANFLILQHVHILCQFD